MCGRYAVIRTARDHATEQLFKDLANAEVAFAGVPKYNAAPMQMLPVISIRNKELRADIMQWWLIPHGSKDGKPLVGKDGTPLKTFNAKGETLDASRLYAPYFRSARCLIPADAFYEWKLLADEPATASGKTPKQPMAIRMKDGRSFMFAGLFSLMKKEGEGEELASFTIITTEPNKLMATIHRRMPVILDDSSYDAWLDRENKDTESLKKLLIPFPEKNMEAYPVSKNVNNARNDGPECIQKI